MERARRAHLAQPSQRLSTVRAMSSTGIIERIVQQNLGVYEVSESRLREDVSQEAQVASDYRGRLVYELLQNADDAMAGGATHSDRVVFVVTDSELWIANSGRALTDEDVQGLCGLGASSKVDPSGKRRASIGHKGLGFKSVLEVTAAPIVFSTSHCFKLGADHARKLVNELWQRVGRSPSPASVPLMRFPVQIDDRPSQWEDFVADGLNTAFCFPFREDLPADRRRAIADLLTSLPLTTVLFLKHLQSIEVHVQRDDILTSQSWSVMRERWVSDRWVPIRGLGESGSYRVAITSTGENAAAFLVAHDADVEIGPNRVGLAGPAWEGVELTEVTVAALEPGSPDMPAAWRHLHVFLPTAEDCPYPIIVNGAFGTDLSRQKVRVSEESGDYNAHLVREAARLWIDALLPVLQRQGIESVLTVLDRGETTPAADHTTAAGLFHAELCEQLLVKAILPTEDGHLISISEAVVPPPTLGATGALFRQVLGPEPHWEGRLFPTDAMCSGRWARIIVDHGAAVVSSADSLDVLATLADPARSATVDHESGGFEVDPLLTIAELLWRRSSGLDRAEVESRARGLALFPVARNEDRTLVRVAIGSDTAFYPPRSARHDLPLRGLRFMCHSLCWGALNQNERLSLLDDQMKAWTSLFDVREFRFEEVARAAVTPALALHPVGEALLLRDSLRDVHALAAICQLAGRFAKPDRPLRYQRLQSDRALFPLSRLPVPCRGVDGQEEWIPAYRVYFGSDWVGEDSVEQILACLTGDQRRELEVHFLAPPSRFLGLLDDPAATRPLDVDELDDEVGQDEDADAAIETDDRARWTAFLSWIGVNSALRLVHFQDVEDEKTGWVTTRDLAQPGGRAFQHLGDTWTSFQESVRRLFVGRADAATTVPYLYEVHDLDSIVPLLKASEGDSSGKVASALFSHFVRHWSWFSAFSDAQLALVDRDKSPGQRIAPPKAKDDELARVGDNLWLHRLQRRGVCPTSHGPRRPDRTWLPSQELDRRFRGRRREPRQFLPVLEVPDGLPGQAVRAAAHRLAVRAEPSPSTFGLEDSRLLCERLRDLYSDPEHRIDTGSLRDVIKPVYRQLFELLSGQSTIAATEGELRGTPLLADTSDGPRFLPSDEILFSRTPGLRERSGLTGAIPTFVLEAEPASFAPLTRLFAVRALEQALEWTPDRGECPLSELELEELRSGLREIVKPLLARIRVERSEPRDTRVLREFVERVEPVDDLLVTCRFDGEVIDSSLPRAYFVQPARSDTPMQVFVVWTEPQSWPPPPEAANSLAMALADALGLNLVETFLAFLRSDDTQRRRLLTIAGAIDLLAEIEGEESDDESGEQHEADIAPTATPDAAGEGEEPAPTSSGAGRGAEPVPLRRFDDLTIDGVAILIEGDEPANREPGIGTKTGQGQHGRRAAIGTDLSALDALGMRITVAYEILRLRRQGYEKADLLVPGNPVVGDTFVVDVHTPRHIQEAEEGSQIVKDVMDQLQSSGVSRLYPGCDLLTVRKGVIDRLIELKSSTVDARVQEMSWNEWKTAGSNQLRSLFWLYLVGNLRADLDHAAPFVRAINDPFGALAAEEKTERHLKRVIQLRVREFAVAEHLDLGVTRAQPV